MENLNYSLLSSSFDTSNFIHTAGRFQWGNNQRQWMLDNVTFPKAFLPLIQDKRYKGAYGGRGGAKSRFFADYLISKALNESGLRAVCIREVQKSLEHSVKQLLEDRIRARNLTSQFEITQNRIRTLTDGIITFQGMQHHTADSVKSLEGYDIAWVEEAQSFSQYSLKLLRPTLRKEKSELWFSWNPQNQDDPVDRFFRGENKPNDSVVVAVNYTDNPFFPEVLRKDMEWDRKNDPDMFSHVWLGGYELFSEARVFKNWRIEEVEPANGTTFLFGADWGFAVDPVVLIRGWLQDERTLSIDREAYKIGCEINDTPKLFDSLDDDKVKVREHAIIADSARPETISYMQNHGYPRIIGAVKGKDSVKEGVSFLKNYTILIHPRCKRTIDEFTAYKYKTDRLTGQILPLLPDKENHTIDAIRYMIEPIRKGASRNGVFLW